MPHWRKTSKRVAIRVWSFWTSVCCSVFPQTRRPSCPILSSDVQETRPPVLDRESTTPRLVERPVDRVKNRGGVLRLTMVGTSSPERLCECREEETREHVVMECWRYEEARRELRRKLGKVELSVRAVLSLVFVYPLLRFLHSTERFPQFLSSL
jgi:hypothetical protein